MEPRLVRRDFVPIDTVCARLSTDNRTHPIRSGKAWIISNGGVERPYGPSCAASLLGNKEFSAAKRYVPDLTHHDLTRLEEEGDHSGGVGGAGASVADQAERRHALAAAYLSLRGTALASISGIHSGVSHFGPLADLHAKYVANHALTTAEVDAVLRIEVAAHNKAFVFGRENLMTVYAAHHQLLRKRKETLSKLAETERSTWRDRDARDRRVAQLKDWLGKIDSISGQLLRTLSLSSKQVRMLELALPENAFCAS